MTNKTDPYRTAFVVILLLLERAQHIPNGHNRLKSRTIMINFIKNIVIKLYDNSIIIIY